MALASVGFFVNVTLSDQGGNRSTLRYELGSASIGAALTDAGTIVAALDAVTDAAIVGYQVGQRFEEDTSVFGLGEVENIASIVAKIDDPAIKYATVKIPAPVDGIFQAASGPGYNLVDPADIALVTYLNIWDSTGGIAFLSDGEQLADPGVAGNVTGKRIHRGSRKG